MNILMISHEFPPVGGGGANACLNLCREYVKAGHFVTVITVYYSGLERDDKDTVRGARIIRIPARRKHKEHCGFPEMLDFMFKAARRADLLVKEGQKDLKEGPFDIGQVFFAIPAGPVGWYLKKKYGLHYVIRFGGGDIPGFQERFKFVYKILGPFERIIWKEASALVANSEGLKKLAEDFCDSYSISVIPNGVDTELFSPGAEIQKNPEDSTFRILFVSRLIERKGLQFVLPHLKKLMEAAGRPLQLTIVGDGPYRHNLEDIADRTCSQPAGSPPLVVFEGQKDKKELPFYYHNKDVFILPSKKEGMPNVVLEAMASSLPVIMTPCQGSEELICGNGFVVSPEDFHNKLLYLMENEAQARAMGVRSLELVKERFLWSNTAEQYLKLFSEIL